MRGADSYILSSDPVLDFSGRRCADLGYGEGGIDAVFPGFRNWGPTGAKGAAYRARQTIWSANHPELIAFLNHSRDINPACANAPPAPPLAVPGAAEPPMEPPAALHLAAPDPPPTAAVMTLYDEAGALPQCAEAPTAYMMGCIRPSDYVAYLRSWRPVLKEGAHCAAMGWGRPALSPPQSPRARGRAVLSGAGLGWHKAVRLQPSDHAEEVALGEAGAADHTVDIAAAPVPRVHHILAGLGIVPLDVVGVCW
eukprot:COSAG04_NODE_2635_length_3827_cov_4.261534_4_plen_253_part_00